MVAEISLGLDLPAATRPKNERKGSIYLLGGGGLLVEPAVASLGGPHPYDG